MYHSKFVWTSVLVGLLVFVVLPTCSLALTLPPQYMPHYVMVFSEAKAYDAYWDIPSDLKHYDTPWEADIEGGTPTGGLLASSRTASSSVGGTVRCGEASGAAFASAHYQSGYIARAISYCWLYWGDTLTITSSTLPNWTPVTLQLTMTLDATTYIHAPYWQPGTFDAEARSTFWIGNDVNNPVREETITYSNTPPPSNKVTMTLNAYVGSQIWIHGEVFFNAITAASSTTGETWASANMSNTAHYNVDVLTAGASYTTSSGVSYLTPVPEPSALITLTLGLAGMAPLVIRRRSVRK